jgi:hypothetical protein
MDAVEDLKLGLNVAAAFQNTSENRRLLAKLRANVFFQEDLKLNSAGTVQRAPLHSSQMNSHRKYSLDEYTIIANAIFSATFEIATVSVLDLRLSVGELLSTAFHDGIGKIEESLTNNEHYRSKNVEDCCKSKVHVFLCAKEWCDAFIEIPSVTVTWPYEVLSEIIQCFKENEHVTDSILMMWHAHTLNLRRLSSSNPTKISNTSAQLSQTETSRSYVPPSFVDEDLAVRIANRRRISRGRFWESVSENVRLQQTDHFLNACCSRCIYKIYLQDVYLTFHLFSLLITYRV